MNQLIPRNNQGKQVDLSEQKIYTGKESADAGFDQAAERLLHPKQWKELSGTGSATFEVIDSDLNYADRSIVQGDYIRIDIPGPGPSSGDGYDWVRVELIESSGESPKRQLGIKLKPCANPEKGKEEASHFFDEASSSTLTVEQDDKTIVASYHGRNETPNNATGNIADNIRNTLIAAGALAGLSEWQWRKLIRGLLDDQS